MTRGFGAPLTLLQTHFVPGKQSELVVGVRRSLSANIVKLWLRTNFKTQDTRICPKRDSDQEFIATQMLCKRLGIDVGW